MFVAFFESFKYVGHLLPITLLRVFLGYYYLNQALLKYRGDFLIRPRLAATIAEYLPASHAPYWYKTVVETQIITNWQAFSYGITALEFAIAFSFIIGFLVRPVAILGLILCLNMMILAGPNAEDLNKTFAAIHFTLAWLGAGRCLGFDYYFYKRQRGLWW